MQVNTGELRSFADVEEMRKFMHNQHDRELWEPVPNNLNNAATKKLAGQTKATVSLTSGGKLSRWAASKRKKKLQKVKATRRKNRHL